MGALGIYNNLTPLLLNETTGGLLVASATNKLRVSTDLTWSDELLSVGGDLQLDGNLAVGHSVPTEAIDVRRNANGDCTYNYIENLGAVGTNTAAGFGIGENGTVFYAMRGERDGSGALTIINAGGGPIHLRTHASAVESAVTRVAIATGGATTIDAASGNPLTLKSLTADRFIFDASGVLNWGSAAANGILSWDTNKAIIGGYTGCALDLYANNLPAVRIDTSLNATFVGSIARASDLTCRGKISQIGAGVEQAATGSLYLLALDDAVTLAEGITIDSAKTSAGTGSGLVLRKANGTPASPADAANNDQIGYIDFRSYSGTKFWQQTSIAAYVDGAVTSGQNPPSRLVFATNEANGWSTERMRLSSRGDLKIGSPSLLSNLNRLLVVQEASTADYAVAVKSRTSGVGYGISILTGTTVNDYPLTFLDLYGNTLQASIRGDGSIHTKGGLTVYDATAAGSCSFATSFSGDLTITPSGGDVNLAGTLNLQSVNGADFTPPSDGDVDLLSVIVSDGGRLWWDHSELSFASTKPLMLPASATTATPLTIGDRTGRGIISQLGVAPEPANQSSQYICHTNGYAALLIDKVYDDYTDGTGIVLRNARGTPALLKDSVAGDQIGYIDFRAFSGDRYWQLVSIAANIDTWDGDPPLTTGQAPPSRIYFATNVADGDSTERMRIDRNGYVGIGTKNYTGIERPTNLLHVYSTTGAAASIDVTNSSTSSINGLTLANYDRTDGNRVGILFGDSPTCNAGAGAAISCILDHVGSSDSPYADIVFHTRSSAGWSEKVRIASTGNVEFAKNIVLKDAGTGTLTHAVPAAVTSYTLTWPAASANGYLKNTGGTLSYSGLAGVISSGVYHPSDVEDTIAANAVTVDFTAGNMHYVDYSAQADACTITLTAPTGPTPCNIRFKCGGNGAVTWTPSAGTIIWSGGTAPDLSTDGVWKVVGFRYDGTYWLGGVSDSFTIPV